MLPKLRQESSLEAKEKVETRVRCTCDTSLLGASKRVDLTYTTIGGNLPTSPKRVELLK